MHLCSACNRRTINALDDDDETELEIEKWNLLYDYRIISIIMRIILCSK